MSTVHATAVDTTFRSNTVRTRRKNPQPTRPIACAECEGVNDCDCLSQLRLLDLMAPLVRQVLEHLATDGSFLDDDVCERLALLADRNDQRERENEAMPELGDAEDQKCDRGIVEDLVGTWGFEAPFLRTVEGVANWRKVPVARVRALLDRFLRDSRPERFLRDSRPEPCAKPRRRAGQSFLFEFVDAEVA